MLNGMCDDIYQLSAIQLWPWPIQRGSTIKVTLLPPKIEDIGHLYRNSNKEINTYPI